ncbi:hypothetical protein F4604DRAFT_112309 [Suillus subluteus]|nr:hypothetical protein F4604DRAFT_112309 [Suillus subluteus]
MSDAQTIATVKLLELRCWWVFIGRVHQAYTICIVVISFRPQGIQLLYQFEAEVSLTRGRCGDGICAMLVYEGSLSPILLTSQTTYTISPYVDSSPASAPILRALGLVELNPRYSAYTVISSGNHGSIQSLRKVVYIEPFLALLLMMIQGLVLLIRIIF